MPTGSVGLALVAGVVSVLSPCVLPLLPIVLGAAATEHRAGPAALASGVALSFVVIGLFVATIGFAIGLDGDLFRTVAAILMIGVGIVLAFPSLQSQFAAAGGPVSNWANERLASIRFKGLGGQFGIGVLLGAAWSPCVGPTLGAASVLAARGSSLAQVSATMLAFGIGAAMPLVIIGLASRQALSRWRHRLIDTGKGAKAALGIMLVLFGGLVVSGFDKKAEALAVELSPQWLTELTTRF